MDIFGLKIFCVLSPLGAPCSWGWLLSMIEKNPPTTSNLNLVNSEVSDPSADPDTLDGIDMADLVESLDARELDIGDGEENDYDGTYLGTSVFALYQWITVTTGNKPNSYILASPQSFVEEPYRWEVHFVRLLYLCRNTTLLRSCCVNIWRKIKWGKSTEISTAKTRNKKVIQLSQRCISQACYQKWVFSVYNIYQRIQEEKKKLYKSRTKAGFSFLQRVVANLWA